MADNAGGLVLILGGDLWPRDFGSPEAVARERRLWVQSVRARPVGLPPNPDTELRLGSCVSLGRNGLVRKPNAADEVLKAWIRAERVEPRVHSKVGKKSGALLISALQVFHCLIIPVQT